MNDQLGLLPHPSPEEGASPAHPSSWELDAHTRHVGLQGLAAARQALHQASARRAA